MPKLTVVTIERFCGRPTELFVDEEVPLLILYFSEEFLVFVSFCELFCDEF